MLTMTWCHSECSVPSGLDFDATGDSVEHVYLWLNVGRLERVPTPLFGRLVRSSAHGRSFARLRKKLKHFLVCAESAYYVAIMSPM